MPGRESPERDGYGRGRLQRQSREGQRAASPAPGENGVQPTDENLMSDNDEIPVAVQRGLNQPAPFEPAPVQVRPPTPPPRLFMRYYADRASPPMPTAPPPILNHFRVISPTVSIPPAESPIAEEGSSAEAGLAEEESEEIPINEYEDIDDDDLLEDFDLELLDEDVIEPEIHALTSANTSGHHRPSRRRSRSNFRQKPKAIKYRRSLPSLVRLQRVNSTNEPAVVELPPEKSTLKVPATLQPGGAGEAEGDEQGPQVETLAERPSEPSSGPIAEPTIGPIAGPSAGLSADPSAGHIASPIVGTTTGPTPDSMAGPTSESTSESIPETSTMHTIGQTAEPTPSSEADSTTWPIAWPIARNDESQFNIVSKILAELDLDSPAEKDVNFPPIEIEGQKPSFSINNPIIEVTNDPTPVKEEYVGPEPPRKKKGFSLFDQIATLMKKDDGSEASTSKAAAPTDRASKSPDEPERPYLHAGQGAIRRNAVPEVSANKPKKTKDKGETSKSYSFSFFRSKERRDTKERAHAHTAAPPPPAASPEPRRRAVPGVALATLDRHWPGLDRGLSRERSCKGDFSFSGLGDKTHSTEFSSGKSDISGGSITDVDRSAMTGAELPVSSTFVGVLRAGAAARSSPGVRRSLPNMAHSHLVHEPAKIYPYHLLLITNYRLPHDVDRLNLERHLSDAEFEAILQCGRVEFYRMPQWRRNEMKRRARLF